MTFFSFLFLFETEFLLKNLSDCIPFPSHLTPAVGAQLPFPVSVCFRLGRVFYCSDLLLLLATRRAEKRKSFRIRINWFVHTQSKMKTLSNFECKNQESSPVVVFQFQQFLDLSSRKLTDKISNAKKKEESLRETEVIKVVISNSQWNVNHPVVCPSSSILFLHTFLVCRLENNFLFFFQLVYGGGWWVVVFATTMMKLSRKWQSNQIFIHFDTHTHANTKV